MPAHGHRCRSWTLRGLIAVWSCACACAWAQSPQAASAAAGSGPENSSLDAPLFYQLLIGEIELSAGHAGSAFEVVFDAAKRTRDETLFRRAVDIALQARAGEQALEATRAWRQAAPASTDARRYQVQILIALNRVEEAGEPFQSWLAQTPAEQRSPNDMMQSRDRGVSSPTRLMPFSSDRRSSQNGWSGFRTARRSRSTSISSRISHRYSARGAGWIRAMAPPR